MPILNVDGEPSLGIEIVPARSCWDWWLAELLGEYLAELWINTRRDTYYIARYKSSRFVGITTDGGYSWIPLNN